MIHVSPVDPVFKRTCAGCTDDAVVLVVLESTPMQGMTFSLCDFCRYQLKDLLGHDVVLHDNVL